MPIYLAPYIGAGVSGPATMQEGKLTKGDPFRPTGWQYEGASWIDLRSDGLRVDGNAIISLPEEIPELKNYIIAVDKAEQFGTVSKQRFRSLIGVQDEEADDVVGLVKAILFRPVNRLGLCKPCLWSQKGEREIWLGGERIAFEVGGPLDATDTDPTDSGAGANQDPLAGNWSTQTGMTGLRRLSNQFATSGGASTECIANYNAVAAPNDQFSEIEFAVSSGGTGGDSGPACRCSSSAQTNYFNSPRFGTFKYVAGAFSTVDSGTFGPPVAGSVIRMTITGSSISCTFNGGAGNGPTTDTSIASGRWGMFMFDSADRLIDWQGGPDAGDTLLGQGLM